MTTNARPIEIFRVREDEGRKPVRVASLHQHSLRKALEFWSKDLLSDGYKDPIFVGNRLSIVSPSGNPITYEAQERQ